MTNKELVEKAAITTAALADAGKLSDAQADKFIDYVIDVTTLKGSVRVVRFRNENLNIDKIGVGSRVTVPKAEATDPGVRRGIRTSKITLTPKEVMTPFEISDTFAEVNLEGEDIENTIIRLMATQMSNDIEELYILGDALGVAVLESTLLEGGSSTQYIKDSFLALMDGWLRLADAGNKYDAANAAVGNTLFSKMITQMPYKFRRNRARLRFFCNPDQEQEYRNVMGNRATALGDQSMTSDKSLTPFGIPLISVPLLPANPMVVEHLTLTGTTAAALRYAPIVTGSVVVTATTLGATPATPYAVTTDYTVNATNGTIARVDGGGIADGATVKVTYQSKGQMLLTHFQNLILGIGRDVRIERDRNIFKGVNEFAITSKVAVQVEEASAIVKGINIG